MVGDPVAGEDDDVAGHRRAAPRPEVLDLHRLHDVATHDAHDPRPRCHRCPQQGPRRAAEPGVRLAVHVLGRHQDRRAAGLAQRQHRGPAHELGPHDHGAGSGRAVLEVHEVLQLTGGQDAAGAVPGDEARRAGALTRAGGQHDGVGGHLQPARRRGHVERALPAPAGHGGLGADLGAAVQRPGHEALGVARPGSDPAKVAHPVAEVVAVPRDPAGFRLAVQHEDAMRGRQLGRGREPRRTGPHDDDVDPRAGHRATRAARCSSRRRPTSAPQ